MKKKNLVLSLIFVLLIFFISSFLYFYYFHFLPSKPKYLTNITELYSLFTPYMERHVNYRLKAVECQPNKYYYDDSAVCFVCGGIDACFGYAWVNINGEERTNPKGLPKLFGKYNADTEISFYSYGVSKVLNCVCEKECICKDNIKVIEGKYGIKFIFPEDINIEESIKKIAIDLQMGDCTFFNRTLSLGDRIINLPSFSCGNLEGIIISNEVEFEIK